MLDTKRLRARRSAPARTVRAAGWSGRPGWRAHVDHDRGHRGRQPVDGEDGGHGEIAKERLRLGPDHPADDGQRRRVLATPRHPPTSGPSSAARGALSCRPDRSFGSGRADRIGLAGVSEAPPVGRASGGDGEGWCAAAAVTRVSCCGGCGWPAAGRPRRGWSWGQGRGRAGGLGRCGPGRPAATSRGHTGVRRRRPRRTPSCRAGRRGRSGRWRPGHGA